MKISLPLSMITLVIVALFICGLMRQNDIASYGNNNNSYFAFNWGKPEKSSKIMAYWKAGADRTKAVKKIVLIDYGFMIVYCIYLCMSLIYYRKNPRENRSWLKRWLAIGVLLVLLCTAIDALQDYKIYTYISGNGSPGDMRYYTWIKWGALLLGIVPLLIAALPRDVFSKFFIARSFRFLSQLLKAIWVFFPGILFLVFPIFCFWLLGQGKDILVAFTDNKTAASFNYFRIIFFLAIVFWVYVSWYSSRIIAYIKKKQQLDIQAKAGMDIKTAELNFDEGKDYFEIGKELLDEIPRMIGNACFLILELAVLQSPLLSNNITSTEAWIFFFISLIILWHINKWITRWQDNGPGMLQTKSMVEKAAFRNWFRTILIIFIISVLVTGFIDIKNNTWILFALLLLLHVVFIFYVNLRRVQMEKNAPAAKEAAQNESYQPRSWLKRSMDYFCIPRKEIGYYRFFLWMCVAGIFFYTLAICRLGFARSLGPFPFIILAFGVLLAFGNIVTAFSVRYKVNFHFLLFLIALLLGLGETHKVRTITLDKNSSNNYSARPGLKTYLTAWLADKKLKGDSCYDMYFVMSNGGASRSGYWTAAVLGKLEDASLIKDTGNRFSSHVFCLSGTSGGGVGVATFFSLLRNKAARIKPFYEASAKAFLKQDYFTYTFARMLGPDFFNYIFHLNYFVHIQATEDRAAALESSFETSSLTTTDSSIYPVPFADKLSAFPAMNGSNIILPILFVNTTRMQDGNPGVVTNLNISLDTNIFNTRIDVVKLLDTTEDISITSGAILGARFPYLSPAGRIANNYFVDGGYFDNSGAGVVQEIIRGILNIAKDDTSGVLKEQIRHLNFKVLHIVNSPVGFASADMKSVAPIKNDLTSPMLTIAGAYNMQTTVNDGRLRNYLDDINRHEDNRSSYTQVSLYESPEEWAADTLQNNCNSQHFKGELPYAMNWFMSDTTYKRINKRLDNNSGLNELINNFGTKPLSVKLKK